jgi:hypothetical protein
MKDGSRKVFKIKKSIGLLIDVISEINMDSAVKMNSIVNKATDHPFTELHEEWWTEKDEELKKSLKESIHKAKLKRLYLKRLYGKNY